MHTSPLPPSLAATWHLLHHSHDQVSRMCAHTKVPVYIYKKQKTQSENAPKEPFATSHHWQSAKIVSRKICTYFFLDTNTDAERREGSKKLKPVLKTEKERKKRKKRNDGRRWNKFQGRRKESVKQKRKKKRRKPSGRQRRQRKNGKEKEKKKRKKERKKKRKKRRKGKKERKKERKKEGMKKRKKKKKKKKSTARGIPRRSPIQVLTSPDVAWLRWSDENRYFQRGMAVDITHSQTNSLILRNESKMPTQTASSHLHAHLTSSS